MVEYSDSSGCRVYLGSQLGRGGEGTVYSLANDASRVAKIYHPNLAASRREKLEVMVTFANPTLLEFACWPLTLLYEAQKRSFAGYVMSNLGQCSPIHQLYNPKSRRTEFPKATYKFLLHTAANVARAFAAATHCGIVIGDVNQNSVMVRADGVVKLIDCDSAQVSTRGRLYRCEVGVPLFTPPELQGCEFSRVDRTEQHDAFGLAVLIFQLLCMGKHPFAGCFLGRGDMPIERAIAERRFPYYRNGKSDFVAPPDSVDIRWLAPCSDLFVGAFVGPTRPNPVQWLDALTALGKSLRSCSENPTHQFPTAANSCPWCAIEARTGALLFAVAVVATGGGAVNIDLLWTRVVAVPAPGSVMAPAATVGVQSSSTEAQVLGKEKRKRRLIGVICALALFALLALTEPVFLTGFLVVICIGISELWASRVTAALRRKRLSERAAAGKKVEEMKQRWTQEASDSLFVSRLRDLEKIRDQAKQLPRIRATKLSNLQSRVRESQLRAYLDRFYISQASIPGIGSGRAAKLSAFGIDTAADITSTMSVQGFGPVYMQRLLDWRAQVESHFRFDPQKGVDRRDVDGIEQEFHRELNRCAGLLDVGPRILSELASQVVSRRHSLQRDYTSALLDQLRAEADLRVL